MNPIAISAAMECAIKAHPNYAEAKSQVWCKGNAYDRPKSVIAKSGLPAPIKQAALYDLSDVERCLWISYFTAESEPEPLTGGGKDYCFILHPVTLQLIAAGVGGWRA
jgi:hypothetical protein